MRFIFCLIMGIQFFSCDFQTSMEVDVPAEEEKLVVNCYISADSVFDVRVWKSTQTVSAEPEQQVENATIVVSDGVNDFPLSYEPENLTYRSTAKAEKGKRYTLSVSAPGYESITSEIVIPEPVEIQEVKSVLSQDPEFVQFFKRTFDIRFKDPVGENFYAIKIFASAYSFAPPFEIVSWLTVNWRPLDPTFTEDYFQELYFPYKGQGHGEFTLLFNDRMFEGKDYTFKLDCIDHGLPDDMGFPRPLEYRIYLKTLSKEYYNYRVTYNKQMDAREDPFAQPVQVFNNIENGYGIFAAYSQSLVLHKVR